MPELPEVEVVRRGLEAHVVGHTIADVEVLHPRAVRRHLPGSLDLAGRLEGQTVVGAERRGKYLWLVLEPSSVAIVVHLGMSGQMLVQDPTVPDEKHLRIRARLESGIDLRFVDQRTFGGWALADLVTVDGTVVPDSVAHIARDPLDPRFDPDLVVKALRAKHTEIKRALLDQTVVSGVGNIYADEALYRARVHPLARAARLRISRVRAVLEAAREVMLEALEQGGTSFDALYVNVNGESGYFDRSLGVYGRTGQPCLRCGTLITRLVVGGRGTHICLQCQKPQR